MSLSSSCYTLSSVSSSDGEISNIWNSDVFDDSTWSSCRFDDDKWESVVYPISSSPLCLDDEPRDYITVKNDKDLMSDIRLVLALPDMCDIMFLVGAEKCPVYGIKAIMAARSVAFAQIIRTAQTHQEGNHERKSKSFSKRCLSVLKTKSTREEQKQNTRHISVTVEEFDPDTFRRVVLYLHTGSVNVSLSSVVGVMNAAHTYGLLELREACFHFAKTFITAKSVLQLLQSTEQYWEYKWTQNLHIIIIDFVKDNIIDVSSSSLFDKLSIKSKHLIMLDLKLPNPDDIHRKTIPKNKTTLRNKPQTTSTPFKTKQRSIITKVILSSPVVKFVRRSSSSKKSVSSDSGFSTSVDDSIL